MLNMHTLSSRNREVGAGIGYGQEKRKMLKDDIFEFFHGPEGYTSLLFGRDEGCKVAARNVMASRRTILESSAPYEPVTQVNRTMPAFDGYLRTTPG